MEFGLFEIFIAVGCLFLSLYFYLTSTFDYWKKRQVKGPKPIPLFGNYMDIFSTRKNEIIFMKELYDEYKSEPVVGIFVTSSPKLILKDPDLIKDVLITDFHVFHERSGNTHEKTNRFLANLANIEYKRWKPLRSRLSPIFTSGKLKDMFYLIVDCANNFQKYVEQLVIVDNNIECRDLPSRFITDAIGVSVFGLNLNCLDNEYSQFREFAKIRSEDSCRNRMRRALRTHFPRIYDLVTPLLEPDTINQYFIAPMKESMEYRKKNNFRRNDFVDMLMDLKENSDKLGDVDFTEALLIAQAYVFFFAGFESSSATLSHALFELAQNQDIQTKLREEILEARAENDGKLTYDCIKSMSYLDKVFKETMRKWPVAYITRKSVGSYAFKNTKVTIPKNMMVYIPIWAIHRDPEIYPDPEVFNPERFNEENEKSRHPMHYLPFGDGPRNCVGSRFANYSVKVGIAAIIEKFHLDVCEKTFKEYRMKPFSTIIAPIDGLFLKFTKV